MRCYCCDKELSDQECGIKSFNTGEYLDMCKNCIKESGIFATGPVEEQVDEVDFENFEEDEFNYDDDLREFESYRDVDLEE